jgi:hypothetical protein
MALYYTAEENVWEEEGTPYEEYDVREEVFRCGVKLRCLWEDRLDVLDDLLQSPPADPPIPRPWPPLDAVITNPPRVHNVSITPVGCSGVSGDEFQVYTHAILDVKYSNAVEDIDNIVEVVEPWAEFIKFDYRQYAWKSDSKPLVQGEAPGLLQKGINFTITVKNIEIEATKLPFILDGYVGTLNLTTWNNPITQIGPFAPGYALYAPPVSKVVVNTLGEKTVTATFKIQIKEGGWNKYWRPAISDYDSIVDSAGSDVEPYVVDDPDDWLHFRSLL